MAGLRPRALAPLSGASPLGAPLGGRPGKGLAPLTPLDGSALTTPKRTSARSARPRPLKPAPALAERSPRSAAAASPAREDPLEASLDGSVVMALGSPPRRPAAAASAPGGPGSPGASAAPARAAGPAPGRPPASFGDVVKLGSLGAAARELRAPVGVTTRIVVDWFNETWRDFDGAGRAPPARPGAALSAAEVRRLRGPLTLAAPAAAAEGARATATAWAPPAALPDLKAPGAPSPRSARSGPVTRLFTRLRISGGRRLSRRRVAPAPLG